MDIPSVRNDHVSDDDRPAKDADSMLAVQPVGTAIIDEFCGKEVNVRRRVAAQIIHGVEQPDNLAAMRAGAAQDDREGQPGPLNPVLYVVWTAQANNLRRAQPGY